MEAIYERIDDEHIKITIDGYSWVHHKATLEDDIKWLNERKQILEHALGMLSKEKE